MKIGFLFPGQGSQSIGIGKDIYEKYESAKRIYNRVEEITGVDIANISFEGPEETLNETKESLNKSAEQINNSLDKMDKILNFLSENKYSWELKDGKIQFTNISKLTEYYKVINE